MPNKRYIPKPPPTEVATLDLEIPDWEFHKITTPAEIAYIGALERAGFPIITSAADRKLATSTFGHKCNCGKTILGMPQGMILMEYEGELLASTIYVFINANYCNCIPF